MKAATTAWRTLGLAVAVTLRSKVKFLLLTTLISISTIVFLGVSELSRASTDDLDKAIQSDLGVEGTYLVELSPDLGLPLQESLTLARGVARQFTATPIRVAVRFPAVRPECPPDAGQGDVEALVLLDAQGQPLPFTPGESTSSSQSLCLAGLVVDPASVRDASAQEKSVFGYQGVVVDPSFSPLLSLADAHPARHSIVIITGRSADEQAELKATLDAAFADAAARASLEVANLVTVTRIDSGSSVRAASNGIRLVYRLIGWGVLIIGGIGILVAEMIVLRDRTWFFGLARAVGARRWAVGWLVLADILIVLAAGLAVALAVLVAAQPSVESFGRTAFQTDLHILRLSTMPGLLLGLALVLVVGGAYPAWRATRLDPLDVLERR